MNKIILLGFVLLLSLSLVEAVNVQTDKTDYAFGNIVTIVISDCTGSSLARILNPNGELVDIKAGDGNWNTMYNTQSDQVRGKYTISTSCTNGMKEKEFCLDSPGCIPEAEVAQPVVKKIVTTQQGGGACPPGTSMVAGKCVCPSGYTYSYGKCVLITPKTSQPASTGTGMSSGATGGGGGGGGGGGFACPTGSTLQQGRCVATTPSSTSGQTSQQAGGVQPTLTTPQGPSVQQPATTSPVQQSQLQQQLSRKNNTFVFVIAVVVLIIIVVGIAYYVKQRRIASL